ncbi:MAG: type VII secretion protein EccCb [Candidatus Dormibacteraeota bacterium]|nr:type VII secretion protein EccCb [Candidatus Dormibacteraeota bacterium]
MHPSEAALLRTPLGIGAGGAPVMLDIKEFAQGGMGPHGMLVGAPGAGKSELLRTLVAGLAATHPPDVLAFVLVDFKGGAAFQPLARLPHVAGLVTNLEDDTTMVERFRLAIEGEVTRRQAVFRAAGNVPDIRTYHSRLTRDSNLAPLPYLWLVVDEFAELLATFPDFDSFFEGVARLGRGLGIHLLLATQGVSSGLSRLDRYLSYRLALRTNSVQESLVVLGSNLAALLPLTPGAGFLKVGQADPERFQAYLVSTPEPRRTFETDPADAVRVFRAIMQGDATSLQASDDGSPSAELPTQLELIVDRVVSAGAPRAHPVWVTPLPRALALDRVLGADDQLLHVQLGLADFPLEQRQEPWSIDFAGQQGHLAVVGAPRTGRSTALRTVVASFLVSHDPRDVQFYVIDMGGALQALDAAAHVGAVAGKADPELARRMLRFLGRVIDERDAEMRRLGAGSISELRVQRRNNLTAGELGDVFLVVDNWGAATKAFDWLEEEVTALAGVGLSYGVHVVLSADRWADVRPALRDRIPGRIQLRPIEPGDSILDARATRALTNTPGRALVPAGHQIQIALPRVDSINDTAGADAAFRELVDHRARAGRQAPPIRLLPSTLSLDSVSWDRTREVAGVPIGVDDAQLQVVMLDLLSRDVQHLLIAGDSRCGKTSFLRAYMAALTQRYEPLEVRFHLVDLRRNLLDAVPDAYVASHAMSIGDVETLVDALKLELRGRVAPPGATRSELAARSHIKGPELILVVDDDDIIDAHALRPLAAAVPLAWDMKFHVVLARRPAGVEYDSLASALTANGTTTLEMSEADRSLALVRPVTLPPGRAHLVQRGQPPVLLQLVHPT